MISRAVKRRITNRTINRKMIKGRTINRRMIIGNQNIIISMLAETFRLKESLKKDRCLDFADI